MWTMGYNEGGTDSFNGGRRLRPLIPRLSPCPTTAVNTDSDHRFNMVMTAMTTEQNKREMLHSETQHPAVMVSSRWNPTPDQLRVLEELYRQGTRTPSADHIQQITAQLRLYGKIEGKNVFYWFQNHKARERQKRRRQMETEQHGSEESAITTNLLANHGFDKKDQPGYRVEQTKNWIRSVGFDIQSEKLENHHHHHHHHHEEDQEPISITMVAAKRSGRHGGDERQSFSVLPPGLYPSSHHPIILNSTTVSSFMSTSKSSLSNAKDTVTVSPVFLSTRVSRNTETCLPRRCDANNDQERVEDCSNEDDSESQEQIVLELFPLRKEGFCSNGGDVEKEKESNLHCFYEFLPLKN